MHAGMHPLPHVHACDTALRGQRVHDTAGRRVVVVAQATPTKESTHPAVDAAAPAKGSSTAAAPPAAEPALLPTGAPVDEPIELAWPAKRSWAEVALTKAVDTVEDVAVIARRTFAKDLPGWGSEFFWEGECGAGRSSAHPRAARLAAQGSMPQMLKIQLCIRHVLCVPCGSVSSSEVGFVGSTNRHPGVFDSAVCLVWCAGSL